MLLRTSLLVLSLSVLALLDPRAASARTTPGRLQRRLDSTVLNIDHERVKISDINEDKAEPSAGCQKCQSSLHFSKKAAQQYAVGTEIPTLGLKTKNSWAGLIPATADKESSFFFWMWGNDGPKGSDSIVIWMNGGPGCSSLYGMMIENGPFLYPSVKGKPFPNEYSWTKEAIMVYLEMPIGTGFTTGEPGILNENNVARQFAIWLDNFFAIFPELKGKRVFLAAESYGGIFAPYIMNHLYDLGNKVNLQGAMLVSGLVSTRAAQEDLAAYDFAVKWANTLKLTKEDLTKVKKESDQCGYTDYLEKNLIYPPRGRLPAFNLDTCGTISTLWNVSDARLPGFNPYRVTVPDPLNDDPLGNPYAEVQKPNFFDNAALQDYIHAPRQKWNVCDVDKVYKYGDKSQPPDQYPSYTQNLLKRAIERSPAGFMMLSGREDMVVLTEGTNLVLQNLTWNDAQGFHAKPSRPLMDNKGNTVGVWTKVRGLTYAIFDAAGHSVPTDAPETALIALQVMLGRRSF